MKFGLTKDGYAERIARAQADLLLVDFDKGVPVHKAIARVNHRLAKIERRTDVKKVKLIKSLMSQYIQQSKQMSIVKAKQQGVNSPTIKDLGNGMIKMSRPKPLLFVPVNVELVGTNPDFTDDEKPLLFGANDQEIIKGKDY